ncbi:MAG: cyclic nucleotide-binding domain-containing protein [Oculatellaceae cyanobacterium bins.114]|nr:cyclic nucleotide-binding domain-containing protein [Oculatellaceae cyanobacterium bins.114]
MKKALYILAEISDRDFEWILSVGRSKHVTAGTVLIHEGEPIDAIYIVLEGTLAVCVESLGGEEVARLGNGEVVGEMSFVDSRRPSATVKALEDALVFTIPRSQLAAKLAQDLSFSSHFYQALAIFLSDRLRSTVSRLGYQKETPASPQTQALPAEENHYLEDSLRLAEARLDWMLNRLKGR